MRKYQQLLLLCLTFCSVSVLLIYKSENSRLKYVLQVVNFFGRNDSVILNRIEPQFAQFDEQLDFSYPLPLWQSIDKEFHAYAAYWNRNELVAGGEAIALVAGKRGAVLNFRCALLYEGGARSIQGKFHFMRNGVSESADTGIEFTHYNFFCRLTRDFGKPESVVFVDISSNFKTAHKLRLRYVKTNESKQALAPQPATICVNLFNYNATSNFNRKESNIMQFFLHHHMLGVNNFIVYNNDELPRHMLKWIINKGMFLHLLPFNFPFASANATESIRRMIESDCIIRNTNLARYTVLLEPNEFVYSIAEFGSNQSVFQGASEINRFELRTFAVCINRLNNLVVDNNMYDPEAQALHQIFLYRLHAPISNNLDTDSNRVDFSVPVSKALVHRYIDCSHVGKDGLHDWRNSLRADFMQSVQKEREDINALLS